MAGRIPSFQNVPLGFLRGCLKSPRWLIVKRGTGLTGRLRRAHSPSPLGERAG
jgi:hypothetical protein